MKQRCAQIFFRAAEPAPADRDVLAYQDGGRVQGRLLWCQSPQQNKCDFLDEKMCHC
jgi:hypothetical protein